MQERKHQFRDYEATTASSQVMNTYKQMQENQNLFFVKAKKISYATPEGYTTSSGNKIRKTFLEVFAELDNIIDESDPDTDLPQIYHAYQTGEYLRALCDPNDLSKLKNNVRVKDYFSEKEWQRLPDVYKQKFDTDLHTLYPQIKDWSWLPLIGFIHDLGKVMAVKEWGALPQWAVVGDTFPVGAPFSSSNIYSEFGFFTKNPDLNIHKQDAGCFGRYKMHCGFPQLDMSWGHDEYIYSVLKRTINVLPEEALYIVRFHSFYPWHTPRNGIRGYHELANERDWMMLPLLKVFQSSDLYSKKADMPDPVKLKEYYTGLIDKFIPGDEPVAKLRPSKVLW